MLVFKCKIKILIIIQITCILYHFKANTLYFKYSWIIKPKLTSLASMALILHSIFERNISLAFQARLIFLSKVLCNIRAILAIRSVLALYALDNVYRYSLLIWVYVRNLTCAKALEYAVPPNSPGAHVQVFPWQKTQTQNLFKASENFKLDY